MQVAHLQQVLLQSRYQALWQQGQPVFAALAVSNRELPPLEVQILHPQPQGLHQPQPTAIQKPYHEGSVALESFPHSSHLCLAEHHRQTLACPGPDHPIQL